VAPNGSDSAACTQAAPCRSFNRAYHLAAAGQTVQVAGGSYGDQALSADASKTAGGSRVTFQPASGATVTVGSKPLTTKTKTTTGLDVVGSTAVTFKNMTIRGDVNAGGGANGVTFENLVTDNGALGVYHASNVGFKGGSYGGTNRYKSEIYPDGSWAHNANISITGVTIHDVRSDDLANYHVEGMLVSDGSGVTISGNTFYNNDVFDLSIGVFGSATLSNVTVENNVFASSGSNFDSSLGINTNTTSWNGLTVRYNSALVYMRHPVCSGGCTNVTYTANVSPLVNAGQCISAVTYRNNVWTNGSGAKCGSSDKSVASAGYVNGAAHDLHLTASSAAVDAGSTTVFPGTDIDGQGRPMGAAPDAGADESH
jgi:hypothetical protein